MSDNVVPTKELERLVEEAAHGEVVVEAAHYESDKYRAVRQLRDMAPALAAEVLAGRKWETQAREALEDDAYRTDKAETVMDALCMLEAQVAKALAALEVPDAE